MSNHDGGYMLNTMMHGLVKIRALDNMSSRQKKNICKLLWHLCCDYDCNWGEIIDTELAVLLSTCMECYKDRKIVDKETGLCVNCSRETQ